MAVLVGYGPRTTEAKRRPRKAAPADPASEQAHAHARAGTFATDAPVSRRTDERNRCTARRAAAAARAARCRAPARPRPQPTVAGGAVLAKPPVRKLAKDLGINLATVPGSGPGGVITRDDVTSPRREARRTQAAG